MWRPGKDLLDLDRKLEDIRVFDGVTVGTKHWKAMLFQILEELA